MTFEFTEASGQDIEMYYGTSTKAITSYKTTVRNGSTYTFKFKNTQTGATNAVSYTHLDVYKRQGYDWPLPFIQGQTKATSIGNQQAVALAGQYRAIIEYDAYSQAPYFHYYDTAQIQHEVWFEDAESIRVKLELANSYPLQGVSYWNLMRPFPQNWLVLLSLIHI